MANRISKIFVTCGFLLLLGGCGINNIPTYEESVKAAWSEVLNQYKRRADLVPNLVNVVKGYATHERETLEAVMRARSNATNAAIPPDILNNPAAFKEFQQAQNQLTGALSRLLAVVENYPNLKANENFLALQSQLEGTENRIAIARRDYILAVQRYNTELRTFPGRIWAFILYRSHKPVENFTQPESVEQVPEVKF